jgi:hypothetical protein
MSRLERRALLGFLLCLPAASGAALAQAVLPEPPPSQPPPSPPEGTARAFLDKLYARYRGRNAKGIDLSSEARLRAIFEPGLAMAMSRDAKAAARQGDVGVLDWDPFIDARDIEIEALDLVVEDVTSAKARATVTIVNSGRTVVITVDLVKLKQGWRIFDIRWPNFKSLRQLFQIH